MPELSEQISAYAQKDPVRFHVPGHKGAFDPLDVTELFFTDNLYAPDESLRLISGLERRAARIFFGRDDIGTSISCGGATLCIQAALLAALRRANGGAKYIICARDCHVSLVNALALLDIEPLWVYPGENFEHIFAHNAGKNIIAAFVTSPDYYGNMRDISALAQVCKKYGAPLIADNSHGSHLAFYKNMHPINCGADISVDSVHKTLPALTGAALAHASPRYDMRGAMQVFASTSPSFLILQSIERMLDILEYVGVSEHSRLLMHIAALRSIAPEYFPPGNNLTDPFRLILNCKGLGEGLYYFLFARGIACEFYEPDRVIIVPSIFNKAGDFAQLAEALLDFARGNKIARAAGNYKFARPKRAMSLSDAVKSPRRLIELCKGDRSRPPALGAVCAEPIFAYPPGMPVILPGEIIDAQALALARSLRASLYIIETP